MKLRAIFEPKNNVLTKIIFDFLAMFKDLIDEIYEIRFILHKKWCHFISSQNCM